MTISSPTLLVDRDRCIRNIRSMKKKADRADLELRPHFKTHQSADIARWFRNEGVQGATVSSPGMAAYFIDHGWDDLTLAIPFNIRSTELINELNRKAAIRLLVSDEYTIHHLHRNLESTVEIYIEIDSGGGRTGIAANDLDALDRMVELSMEPGMVYFRGFYSHPGHSYGARSETEILAVHEKVLQSMQELKDRYGTSGRPLFVCIGDTPCCSAAEQFNGIDELSPGNFVFYDLMQVQIGACRIDDIALALVCPIIHKSKRRNELVVHAGAVHLSKENLQEDETSHYGLPVELNLDYQWGEPLKGSRVSALSQEHGTIACSKEVFEHYEVGDLIGILPVHSCLTADLMGGYVDRSGNRLNHVRSC